MESPHSGLLKSRAVVAGIPMQVVDYCRYGKPYRKRTSIFNNCGWVPQRPLCRHDCPATIGKRHVATAQLGNNTQEGRIDRRFTRDELYSIPPELCDEIAAFALSRH